MAEALIQSGSLVLFATHFTELGTVDRSNLVFYLVSANRPLANVLADRPGVLNLHLATETSRTEDNMPKMTMLYKVSSGPVQDENYGIKLAGAIGFSPSFLQVAEHVSDALRDQAEVKKQGSQARKLALRRRLVLNLQETLEQAYASDLNDGALSTYLRRLQGDFIRRMEKIDGLGMDADGEKDQAADIEDMEE